MESWSLAVVAVLLIGYAAVSRRLELSVVSAGDGLRRGGALAGPEVLGWMEGELGSQGVRVLAEATLTLVLFADASRINIRLLRREVGVPVRLLGIGLPLTIVAGTFAAALVFPELGWPEALVLAIVLAPTDAALGQAVVTDKRLPSRVRQSLNVESGLNDGICVPLLFIALAIAEAEEQVIGGGAAARIVAEEIGYGIVGGVAAGAVAALVFGCGATAVGGRGLGSGDPAGSRRPGVRTRCPLGGSGFIAAFVGGLVFGGLRRREDSDVGYLTDATGLTLAGVTFVVFGAVALGPALHDVGWQIVLYAVLSLTILRMAPVWLSFTGTGARKPTVAFAGWFGPRGLASIVFAVLVLEGSELEHVDLLVVTAIITVALSVFAHGMTAVPLTTAYARWFDAQAQPPPMESQPAREVPWRTHER